MLDIALERKPVPLTDEEKAGFRRLYDQLKAARIGALAA